MLVAAFELDFVAAAAAVAVLFFSAFVLLRIVQGKLVNSSFSSYQVETEFPIYKRTYQVPFVFCSISQPISGNIRTGMKKKKKDRFAHSKIILHY